MRGHERPTNVIPNDIRMYKKEHLWFFLVTRFSVLSLSFLITSCGSSGIASKGSSSSSRSKETIVTIIKIENKKEIVLYNSLWKVYVNPMNQKVWTVLPNGEELILSHEGKSQEIKAVRIEGDKVIWTQIANKTAVEVRLVEDQLVFTWKPTTEGEFAFPILQASQSLKSYLLPLKEGIRIQPKDSAWLANLADQKEWEMTESLSMPVFLLEYANQGISYLFAENPFSNTIKFKTSEGKIDLSVWHESTPLAIEPYQVLISLEEPNLLAGSKRYRDWLQHRGEFVHLKDKIAQAKDGEKLIGAGHTYFWGNSLLGVKDIADWKGFLMALSNNNAWRDNLSEEAREFLSLQRNLYKHEREALLEYFEVALFKRQGGRRREDYNSRRALVEKELQVYLTSSGTWGNGLTTVFVNQIRETGMDRILLLTTEPLVAYYHPEAVQRGEKLGFLIGSYDSYNTALPVGYNDNWGSANIGEEAFKTMGVIKRNGEPLRGFGGNGVYLNAGAVRSLMEDRVQAIQKANEYNVWFLDVDAAGMLLEDYDPVKLTNKRRDLKNRVDNMAWVAKNLKVIVGSEDGVALASSPIAYAHGMQTMGFGWRDADMRKDKNSPFYLGAYYPDNNPTLFFKSILLKEMYTELYFNPKTRVPLFQACMHDSLITTLHWQKDLLKFMNVQTVNELLHQLYNVAPLVNLSQESASQRLPYLKNLQDFFSPVHQHLAYASLDSFRWLDEMGLIQETGFSDGSSLVGNFGMKEYKMKGETIPALSVVAFLVSGETLIYRAQV